MFDYNFDIMYHYNIIHIILLPSWAIIDGVINIEKRLFHREHTIYEFTPGI